MKHSFFFILGNNPTLSIAELSAAFGLDKNPNFKLISSQVFVIDVDEDLDARVLIRRLGGVIKMGEVIGREPIARKQTDNKYLLSKITGAINTEGITGKFNFGISFYGKRGFNDKPLAMEIKKFLREKNISSRWVISREPVLSSVVVEQNKLVGDGIEIVLIDSGGEILIGRTLTVQPFKELSHRDYGRPGRDDFSGMLPPKLAQIMINLAGVKQDATILDPFCGSGTVLTEAMLMGYQNLIGVDVSEKAIEDTKKNIIWTKNNFSLLVFSFSLFNRSSTELSKFIKANVVMDAIITEPYLGPQRGKLELNKVVRELEELYTFSIREFGKVLSPGGKVVMIWPVFMAYGRNTHLNPNLSNFKIINPIPEILQKNVIIKLTDRNTIIYGREGQKVWREVVVMIND
jgi:tRNA G10  N-methylase Trm11